jgi:hypothetical protein
MKLQRYVSQAFSLKSAFNDRLEHRSKMANNALVEIDAKSNVVCLYPTINVSTNCVVASLG